MAQQKKIKYITSFSGYKNLKDILKLKPTDLIAGSQNVWIEEGARLDSRAGMDFFGAEGTTQEATDQSWTLPHRIHSSYDLFVNNQGVSLPIRVYYSGTSAQGDVFEVWLNEYDTNGVALTTKKWYQITADTPATPVLSKHQIYFTEWFDPLNKQNQLVMASGNTTVNAWSGGFAPIIAVTGTTLQTTQPWREMGFIESIEGVNSVVINGVTYALTSGDFSTDTITVASTAGVTEGDVAFQTMRTDTIDRETTPTGFTADVCQTVNNQVYYLDWNKRGGLVSWNRNQDSSLGKTSYQGTSGLNDAVFGGTYTGTNTKNIEVTIDSITPAIDIREATFTGQGINDILFQTSGYTGTGTNVYKVVIVADGSFTFVGTPSIIADPGDIITGSISGAQARVAFLDVGGQDPALIYLSNQTFVAGDVVTGTQGTYGTVFSVVNNDWFQLYKNDVAITPTAYSPAFAYQLGSFNPVNFVDGLSFSFESGTWHVVGDYWTLTINQTPSQPDTFSWTINGDNQATNVSITGASQALINGLTVSFVEQEGHDVGDKWIMTAYPETNRGWRQVYHTLPTRLPGEGFEFNLDSNGWALAVQEKNMYVNAQGGEWYTITTSLDNETISLERLKTEQQFKILYPYLSTPYKDFLAMVTLDKSFDIMGRQKFLELPQTRTLSDAIRIDFDTSDWEDGQLLYFKRKMFFCLPKEGKVLIWDDMDKYWHTPHYFARRVSRFAIIDNKLIGHSYERNESYEMYTGLNDLGLFPIETRIVSSYHNEGFAFDKKSSSAFVCEGYIDGVPEITWTVNMGIGGCYGKQEGTITPVFCIPGNTASLGKSTLGYHGLGNDPVDVIPHFFYGKTFDGLPYYHRNIEFYCNSMDQRWSMLSYGIDVERGKLTNSDIFNPGQ